MGEEYVGVLCHTAHYRAHRAQCTLAEFLQRLHIYQRTQIFHIHYLNFLILVRGTETVEEVQERHAALDRCQVGYTGQIHHFLYTAFGQHGKTCLTASHHILMVTEDTQHVAGKRTSRYMEYGRQQLAGYLVHVRNHQQQSLRCGERRGQRTCLKRTVYSACCTALALHLLYQNSLAEHVLAALCCPLINVLRHGRRRSDRINGGYLAEHIRNMRCCSVAVHCHKFLFCHRLLYSFLSVCIFSPSR